MDLTVLTPVLRLAWRWLSLLMCLWMGGLAAQAPSHLSFRHVLPDQIAVIGFITAIAQDEKGFMWFGGNNGLARYDGYNLKVYRQDLSRPEGLVDSHINDLLIANDGSFWVATRKGLQLFDSATNQFTHFVPEGDSLRAQSAEEIYSICEDREGNFWLGTRGGFYYFERATGRFTLYEHLPTGSDKQTGYNIWRVVQDQDGYFWLGLQAGGVSRFDPRSNTFVHYPHIANSDKGPSFPDVREVYVDSNNTVWLGTYGGGLNRFDRVTERFHKVIHDTTEKGAIVWAIREDRQGNLWVGDGSAVYMRAAGDDVFARFTNREDEPTSPGNYVVNRLFEDSAGDMWLGFFPAGIDMVDRQASVFHNYRYSAVGANSVSDGGVLSAFEDPKGNLWIGAGYGLSYFDRERNHFTNYRHDPQQKNSLSGDTILSVVQGRRNHLWLGIWSGGLNKLDLNSGKFTHYLPQAGNSKSLMGREAWSVIEDRAGNIWVATEEGLSRYDYATDSFTRYMPPMEMIGGESVLYSRVVYEDTRGGIWLGSIRGLFLLNPATGHFTHYPHDAENAHSLGGDFVFAIFEDSRGNLWVGTDGGGLSLLDRERGTFINYTQADGLIDNVVAGIIEDAEGYLWLGTQKGLSRFDPLQQTFRNYDKRHGLADNLFNRNTPVLTKTQDLFFGNSKGFTLFNPARLTTNTLLPEVVFTDLLIFNKSVQPNSEQSPLQKTITHTETITLNHSQSVFSLEFAALNYHLSEENKYAYQLVGFDKEWQYVGNKRTATYTNLDAGSYRFEVKAANDDGVWNVNPVRLNVEILPPLWKTWWAYCSYACLLLLLLYWFSYTNRMKLFYEQKKLEQERVLVRRLTDLDKLKDEFLANTSHELRTPLNGIIGLAESLIAGNSDQLDAKTRYNLAMIVASGNRLASLVDDILDFSKLKNEALVLRKKPIDLHVLVDIVLTLSQPLIDKKPVLFINRIPMDSAAVFADEDRLVQIFHNLIGNAAKFTDRGSITISVDRMDQALAIHVADTGIGIPADDLEHVFTSFMQVDGSAERRYGGTGLGLSITRQLVKLHGGDMSVQSVFGEGSIFTFTLPIVDEAVVAEAPLIQDESRHIPDYGYLLVSHDDAQLTTDKTEKNVYEHILVVDDDPINRLVLVNFLSLRNYQISEAASGEEAIALIADGGAIDLVLLDIMMPRMSGYQTCKALRKTFPAHELPIILLTARSQTSDLVMGFDLGANDFLTKPVTKEELLARVATHLQLRDVTRNLDSKVAERTEELQRKNLGLRTTQLELESAYQKLEQASLSDPLTGLHNRRFLNKFLAADVAIVEREYLNWTKASSDEPIVEKPTESDFIFIMLDVDYFKSVNDNFGHGVGDRVLEQFGEVLKTVLRESDYLVRWGGEEFLVVVRFTARAEAGEMAERIRQAVASYRFDIGNDQVLQKTCSVGFACYPFYEQAPSVMSWEQVVDTADRALYAAKKSGRNCCVGLAAGVAADTHINPAVDENLPMLITQQAILVSAANVSLPLQW